MSSHDTSRGSANPKPPPRGRGRRRRLRLPRYTIRLRLALLYGAAFLISGTLLLALIFASVAHTSHSLVVSAGGGGAKVVERVVEATPSPLLGGAGPVIHRAYHPGKVAADVNSNDLHDLLIWSLVALAIMVAVSMAVGWMLAGRVLRPLHTITTAARELSASNLHERLALEGPHDELRELGDTFDDLLGRLESSFESQRQFVANASHELRTPLTLERAILEVTLADPQASAATLRAACERVLAIGEQQERMIDALLTLARSERGLERRRALTLETLTEHVLGERREEIARRGLRLDAKLEHAPTSGDPRLIERLVANLLDNAIRHNVTGGWVTVTTMTTADEAVLTVANSGPTIAADELERVLRPFHRLGTERVGHGDGHGLGLSIVAAIASAHEAKLDVSSQPDGGLLVEVHFRVS